DQQKFDPKEKRFLTQIAEAVSLSIERTFQNQKTHELKRQWEATFDAISDPICLTDQDYNILRVNAGFLKRTQTQSSRDHRLKKCYQSLFGREEPCQGCQRGQVFQVRNGEATGRMEIFDVYSNDLSQDNNIVYFQMYRDITSNLNLQRQIIETAKMAELGTISSSIAHELNNPIGGMLNFVQLMKMDLSGEEDFFEDIQEIEKGIIKCKDIVKNLLGFSRKSFHNDVQEIFLKEVIDQAIMITELKTRSIGIQILFDCDNGELSIPGRYNLLTHAIRNILQNAQESLVQKRKQDKGFQGVIEVLLSEKNGSIEIEICDNGDGISDEKQGQIFDPLYTTKDPETNPGLGLTLALQIVKEHNGTILVSTRKDKKLSFKLVFFKSEVQSGQSEF
ncbi:MAG: HAMP domain-containing sensor histidine kinase, partial [Pseudomonadota bacterium]